MWRHVGVALTLIQHCFDVICLLHEQLLAVYRGDILEIRRSTKQWTNAMCSVQSKWRQEALTIGGSRISGRGSHMCKGGGRFADFISFFMNIPWKWNNLVSRNQIISFSWDIKILGTGWGGGGGGGRAPTLIPLWIRHWAVWKHVTFVTSWASEKRNASLYIYILCRNCIFEYKKFCILGVKNDFSSIKVLQVQSEVLKSRGRRSSGTWRTFTCMHWETMRDRYYWTYLTINLP